MNNAQLLERMMRQYGKSSLSSTFRYSPVIIQAQAYLEGLEQSQKVNEATFKTLMAIFLPLLNAWDPSKKVSGTLSLLPFLINEILKSLSTTKTFNLTITLKEIKKFLSDDIRWVFDKSDRNGQCFLKTVKNTDYFNYDFLYEKKEEENEYGFFAHHFASFQTANSLEMILTVLKVFNTKEQKEKDELTREFNPLGKTCKVYTRWSKKNKDILENLHKLYQSGSLISKNKACILKMLTSWKSSYGFMFMSLETAGKLTDEDKSFIVSASSNCRPDDTFNLLYGLYTLNNAGLLTEENRKCLMEDVWDSRTAHFLVILHEFRQLTLSMPEKYAVQNFFTAEKADFLKILKSTLYEPIGDFFRGRGGSNTISQKEKDKARLECLKAILDVYGQFYDQGLLVPENRALINKIFPINDIGYVESTTKIVAEAFILLEKAQCLTVEDKEILCKMRKGDVVTAITYSAGLKAADLFTEDNKAMVFVSYEHFSINYAYYASLLELKEAKLLTVENKQLLQQISLVNRELLWHCVPLMVCLNRFNSDNAVTRKKYLTPEFLSHVPEYLKLFEFMVCFNEHVLLAKNFDFMLDNALIFTEKVIDRLIESMAKPLLTQAIWDGIKTLAQASDSEQKILQYLEQALNPLAATNSGMPTLPATHPLSSLAIRTQYPENTQISAPVAPVTFKE